MTNDEKNKQFGANIDQLSCRARQNFRRLEINNIDDLLNATIEQLLACKNLGAKTLKEIIQWLPKQTNFCVDKKCKTCYFWDENIKEEDIYTNKNTAPCRRNPCSVNKEQNEWCGEWLKRNNA